MSTVLLVGRGRQPSSPLGLGHKKPKNPKKYGANAPQLRAIRCPIDFCVMLCNKTAFNPVQTWLSGLRGVLAGCHPERLAVILSAAKDLFVWLARPFAEFTLSEANVLRVTGSISTCLSAIKKT